MMNMNMNMNIQLNVFRIRKFYAILISLSRMERDRLNYAVAIIALLQKLEKKNYHIQELCMTVCLLRRHL